MLKQISSFDGIKVSHIVMGEGGGFPPGGDLSFPAVHRELQEGTILFILLNSRLQLYGAYCYNLSLYVNIYLVFYADLGYAVHAMRFNGSTQ